MLSLEQDFTKRQLYLDEVRSCLGKYGSSQTLFPLILFSQIFTGLYLDTALSKLVLFKIQSTIQGKIVNIFNNILALWN